MLPFLKDPVKRGWALLAALGVVLVALAGPAVYDRDARHLTAYRDADEDVSAIREALEGRAGEVQAILSTPHQLAAHERPDRVLFVSIGAERQYSEGEARAVVEFLRAGGNVILADEGGYGTDVAAEAGWAFGEQGLLDTSNFRADPSLVVAEGRAADRTFRLLFNAPTALVKLSNAGEHEVLAASSRAQYPEGSYLETNDNGEIDIADTPGPWPLVVRTQVGEGTLILVADTGLFMNQQAALVDFQNADFVAALAGETIPSDGLVVLDEARHAPPPALAAVDNAVRTLGRATSGVVAPLATLAAVLLVAIVVWWTTRETEDWTHHVHDVGHEVPAPADLRPDLDRAQRMARHRISEKFNIPLEQVAAMPAEQLVTLTGDKLLAEAAAGTLRSDPAPLFRSFSSTATEAPQ